MLTFKLPLRKLNLVISSCVYAKMSRNLGSNVSDFWQYFEQLLGIAVLTLLHLREQ